MMMFNPVLLATATSGIGFLKPLYWLFGVCMNFLLSLLSNQYFLAIVIFTVLTRVVLLPLNIRQQRTMSKSTRLQPKLRKIQKKYDPKSVSDPRERQRLQQKLNEETQALYAREGHNPMQLGCGPMLFQMLFLMGIVGIIYYPLSYVIGINNFADLTGEIQTAVEALLDDKARYIQLSILENWETLKDSLVSQFPAVFTEANCADIEAFRSGLYIGNLDMTAIPTWSGGIIVIVPILSFLTALGSSFVSMRIQKKNNPAMAQQMGQMTMMMLMMPFFSLFIAFQVPAAVGFYWIISNLVAILQQIFIAKAFPPKKSQARLMVENTIERRSREENIKKIK
ncbi:MAG: membrane protein insertase YidC [Eubacterium sp.]|nr:membrane protein insertase YidC [Eubacterium sp.]